MQRLLAGFLFLALTFNVSAQVEPPKPIPKPVAPKLPPASIAAKAGDLIVLAVESKGDVLFVWDDIAFPAKRSTQIGKTLYLTTPFNGVYTVQSVLLEEKAKYKTVITVTGGTDPPPGPPNPPPVEDSLASLTAQVKALTAVVTKLSNDTNAAYSKLDARIAALESPRPPPIPPIPVPPPTPAPIPLDGFRVMIVYDPTTLTASQEGIVFGKKVRDYLQARCVVGADGKTKDFRIYQTGLDTSAEVQWINNVIQRHPGQKSWMVVSDGKTGYDGPIPASADEAIAIFSKIGGQP